MTIDPQTLASLLQIGGQYLIPIAALLRALYAGTRGRMPEGFTQIAVAGATAGLAASVSGETFDLRTVLTEALSNTAFTVGVLSFTVLYLLRLPNKGLILDGIVGGVIGLVIGLFTVNILGEAWPWWFVLLLIPACAAGFIALRFALRQIMRLVRLATWLLSIGLLFALGAGAFLLLQTLTQGAA